MRRALSLVHCNAATRLEEPPVLRAESRQVHQTETRPNTFLLHEPASPRAPRLPDCVRHARNAGWPRELAHGWLLKRPPEYRLSRRYTNTVSVMSMAQLVIGAALGYAIRFHGKINAGVPNVDDLQISN